MIGREAQLLCAEEFDVRLCSLWAWEEGCGVEKHENGQTPEGF